MKLPEPAWLGRFEIVRTGRTVIRLQPAYENCVPDEVETIMVEELHARKELATVRKSSEDGLTVNTWLKITCYQIILAWMTVDDGEQLLARLGVHNRFVRGTKKDDRDIFQEGIVAIFAKNPSAVSVRDRDRLAAPMWHGFRHYIQPALLEGFNRQYPAHIAQNRGWKAHLEPALKEWIIEQRTYSEWRGCNLDQFRGIYPASIENRIVEAPMRRVDHNDWLDD